MNKKAHGLALTEGRVNTLLLRFAGPYQISSLVSALYLAGYDYPDFLQRSICNHRGRHYLKAFTIDCVLVAFSFSMAHSIAATFGLRVPMSIVFSRMTWLGINEHLYFMGLAQPIASVLSLILCFAYILWQNKKYKESLRQKEAV